MLEVSLMTMNPHFRGKYRVAAAEVRSLSTGISNSRFNGAVGAWEAGPGRVSALLLETTTPRRPCKLCFSGRNT